MQMLDTTIDQLRITAEMSWVTPPSSNSPSTFEATLRPMQEKEARREHFLAAILGQKNLRNVAGYMWLYRHDRQWLKQILKIISQALREAQRASIGQAVMRNSLNRFKMLL